MCDVSSKANMYRIIYNISYHAKMYIAIYGISLNLMHKMINNVSS